MNAQQFYKANATNVVNVPRPGHPEDPSGIAGVRSASQAQYMAPDVQVMPLCDVFDFAEKYAQSCVAALEQLVREARTTYADHLLGCGWKIGKACDCGFSKWAKAVDEALSPSSVQVEPQPNKCVSCGTTTDYCCADCMIDKKQKVYVCGRTECRDKHERNGCTCVGI